MEEYTFTFNKQDLEILNKALLDAPIPYKFVAPLITKINEQIATQEHE